MTKLHRMVFAGLIVAIAAGWWATHSPNSPFSPKPKDRPVLRLLARVAKLGLWVALAAEKPPTPEENRERQSLAKFDENGNRVLNHEEGW